MILKVMEVSQNGESIHFAALQTITICVIDKFGIIFCWKWSRWYSCARKLLIRFYYVIQLYLRLLKYIEDTLTTTVYKGISG